MDTPTPTVLLVSLVQAQAASPRGLCCFRSHFARRAPVGACAPSPSPLGPPLALGACLPRFLHAKQPFRFLAWRIMLGIVFLRGRLGQPARSKWQKTTEFGNHPVSRAGFSREGESGLACNLVLCSASVFGVTSTRVRHDSGLPNSMPFCHRRPRRMTGIAFGEGK